jgi:hypothetical protein
MNEHLSEGGHSKAKLAAEIGLGAAGVAAVVGVGLTIYKRRKALHLQEELHNSHAEIFNNDRLKPKTRWLMARTAALLYHATLESESGIITEDSLRRRLDVRPRELKRALEHLEGAELIVPKINPLDETEVGFQAEPTLVQAVESGAASVLHHAVHELMAER